MTLSNLRQRVIPGRPSTGTVRAVRNGAVLAETDDTSVVEGTHDFPRRSLREEYLVPGSHASACPWRGVASSLTIDVDGKRNEHGAWYHASPSPAARKLKDRVAFRRGVRIERG